MRPSLAKVREEEILLAVEACIREVGIAGLTTQLVAAKSGFSRSHIRHYLGNKDDLLIALVHHYTDRYANSLQSLVEEVAADEQREVVIRELFGDTWQDLGEEDDLVLDQLNAYASASPDTPSLAPMYTRIAQVVAGTLEVAGEAPAEADRRARTVVAFAYGVSTMLRLGVIDRQMALSYARDLMLL